MICIRGGSRGGPAPPYFWQSQFYFFTLHSMSEKIFLKLNMDFIVAKIRGFFGSVGGVCVCVWIEIVAATVFVQQRPNFDCYPRPFWSQKYMPDCRKSHLIFQNFSGEAPRRRSSLQRSVRGFPSLPGPPSKIPGSTPVYVLVLPQVIAVSFFTNVHSIFV